MPVDPDAFLERQVGDADQFAWSLLRLADAGKSNALVSPLGARRVFGMVYLGARGATETGLARALDAADPDAFAAGESSTRASLNLVGGSTTLEIADSVWLNSDWTMLDSWRRRCRTNFGDGELSRRFGAGAVKDINAWVARRTHGRISRLIESLSSDDKAVLLDAIYFKGLWSNPFPRRSTKIEDFHSSSGKVVRRPRMRVGGDFDYAETDGLQIVRLPYQDGRLSMTILLPAKGRRLEPLLAAMSGARWRGLLSRLKFTEGVVEIPRFKFDATVSLKAPLSALGAADAFDRARADFGAMARARRPEDRLYISRAEQKAVIAVDEKGTVAVAATGVVAETVGARMADMEHPFVFTADRPFLFAVGDRQTGALLFVGVVRDP